MCIRDRPKGERFIMFVAPKDVISEVWHGFRWGLKGAEKEFKADKAHSINELRDLLPTYINGSDELVFSIGKHPKIEKIVLEIFSQQLEIRSRSGIGANSIKSPEIYLNEMRIIKSEFEIKRMRDCLLYTSPSPRDLSTSRMPSSA